MKTTTDILFSKVRDGEPLLLREQSKLLWYLALPAILSQLTVIVMQYADAAMVGSMGAGASAAIGLVSTTTWLLGGICSSVASGFSVQVAHRMGAKQVQNARSILRQAILATLGMSFTIAIVAILIAPYLPHWLGGGEDICHDATVYFSVFALTIPLFEMNYLMGGMLRCAGNMKVPSAVSILGCLLNVGFNALFIFGCHLGVLGAALGSLCSMCITVTIITVYTLRYSELKIYGHPGSWRPEEKTVREAFRIGGPMAMEHIAMCSAQIFGTMIVAPLGTAAIAANAFGVIIEGLCYMPGYGIGDAATTLVGQSIGAGRKDLRQSFSWLSVGLGVSIMTIMGMIMYIGVPYLMPLMTPDVLVQDLTTMALRIEAFAEPGYALSIVIYGVFVGAGDTLMPCLMNLGSIWAVRIPLALVLSKTMGLKGVWIAMAVELCFRGLIFLIRLIIHNNENYRKSRIWRRAATILRERYEAMWGNDSRG